MPSSPDKNDSRTKTKHLKKGSKLPDEPVLPTNISKKGGRKSKKHRKYNNKKTRKFFGFF